MCNDVPMLIPVGYADLQLLWTITGDSEVMQSHIGVDVGDVGGDFQDALEMAVSQYGLDVQPAHSVECTLIGGSLVVGQDGGDPVSFDYTTSVAGADGDFPLPPNVATLVRKTTAPSATTAQLL